MVSRPDAWARGLRSVITSRSILLVNHHVFFFFFVASVFVDVEVWATDLWVPPHRNFWRIAEAGLMEQVYAVHAEARAYPFQAGFFDGAVSVDAYHYWGGVVGHIDYVASFVKPGGTIAIVVAGEANPDLGFARVVAHRVS